MWLRRWLPFAMMLAIAVCAASAKLNAGKARSDAQKPHARSRAPAPAAAFREQANKPGRRLEWRHRKGELLLASLVPIQFKDPRNLGVGKLLVASRGLADPSFAETVVLLVHYDDKGVLGLILNRRTDLPLSQVLKLKAAKDRSDPVYLGGPVQLSAVFALYRSTASLEKAEKIFGDVYLISDKDLFEQTLSTRPGPGVFHVYAGYAGWTQAQLQAEVQSGAWFVMPADAGIVFSPHPDSLWLQMIQKTKMQWAMTAPLAAISEPDELIK